MIAAKKEQNDNEKYSFFNFRWICKLGNRISGFDVKWKNINFFFNMYTIGFEKKAFEKYSNE